METKPPSEDSSEDSSEEEEEDAWSEDRSYPPDFPREVLIILRRLARRPRRRYSLYTDNTPPASILSHSETSFLQQRGRQTQPQHTHHNHDSDLPNEHEQAHVETSAPSAPYHAMMAKQGMRSMAMYRHRLLHTSLAQRLSAIILPNLRPQDAPRGMKRYLCKYCKAIFAKPYPIAKYQCCDDCIRGFARQ